MPSSDQSLVPLVKSVSQVPTRPAERATRYRASLSRKCLDQTTAFEHGRALIRQAS